MKTLTNETYIYSLSNEDDVIRYIGKSNNLKDRLSEHINESKKGVNTRKNRWILSSLNNDKTIKIKIIDIVPNSEWTFWEKHYISLYKSWGFNLTNATIGGNGTGAGVNNPNYGKKLTDEHKKKCSLKLSGDKNPFYGKKHSLKIMMLFYKPIIQYSLKGKFIRTWNSIKEAEVTLSIHSISSCCNSKLLSAGGFVWRFLKNSNYEDEIIISKTYRKSVYQYTLNGEYIKKWNSVSEVEKELKIKHISKVCNKYKSHKTSGGFIWKYDD